MGTVEPLVDCQPQPAGSFPGLFLDGIDNDGHGTLLAGTIAAVPGNAIGVASPVPTPWNISLMPVKFFDAGAPATASNAAIAIVHAAIHFFDPLRNATPVKVINLSWHVAPGDWGALVTLNGAITFASLLGCLVVFAAGNDGTDNEVYPTYPANLGSQNPLIKGQVLTVLATDRYDAKASFSNYGRHIVDIGAPGLHILSTGRYLVNPPRYAEYSGTGAGLRAQSAKLGRGRCALLDAARRRPAPEGIGQHDPGLEARLHPRQAVEPATRRLRTATHNGTGGGGRVYGRRAQQHHLDPQIQQSEVHAGEDRIRHHWESALYAVVAACRFAHWRAFHVDADCGRQDAQRADQDYAHRGQFPAAIAPVQSGLSAHRKIARLAASG